MHSQSFIVREPQKLFLGVLLRALIILPRVLLEDSIFLDVPLQELGHGTYTTDAFNGLLSNSHVTSNLVDCLMKLARIVNRAKPT